MEWEKGKKCVSIGIHNEGVYNICDVMSQYYKRNLSVYIKFLWISSFSKI